jgi:hypothetical protein
VYPKVDIDDDGAYDDEIEDEVCEMLATMDVIRISYLNGLKTKVEKLKNFFYPFRVLSHWNQKSLNIPKQVWMVQKTFHQSTVLCRKLAQAVRSRS